LAYRGINFGKKPSELLFIQPVCMKIHIHSLQMSTLFGNALYVTVALSQPALFRLRFHANVSTLCIPHNSGGGLNLIKFAHPCKVRGFVT